MLTPSFPPVTRLKRCPGPSAKRHQAEPAGRVRGLPFGAITLSRNQIAETHKLASFIGRQVFDDAMTAIRHWVE